MDSPSAPSERPALSAFRQSKNLTAGEGGALLTNDADLAEQLWSIANCGRRRDGEGYEHPNLGTNLRLSGWQAAVLSAGLTRLDDQLQRRMINARRLRGFLAEIDGLTPQRWDPRADAHAHHLFLMRYDAERFGGLSRQKFITALRAENIPASSLYAYPLYRQPPLFEPFSRVTPCPNSEMLCEQTHLPEPKPPLGRAGRDGRYRERDPESARKHRHAGMK